MTSDKFLGQDRALEKACQTQLLWEELYLLILGWIWPIVQLKRE